MQVDPSTQLRAAGLTATPQRVAVLHALADHPHAAADEVLGAVRTRIGAASRQAVFDALNTLTDRGIVRRIQPTGSPARYEARTGDNHHHLVCRSCGVVVDVDCAVGERPCLTAADAQGFEIDEAEVVYWGRCPACQGADDATSPASPHHPHHPRGAS